MTKVHVDGDFNVEGCRCTMACEFPCWQRVGLTEDGCSDRSHKPCGPLGPIEHNLVTPEMSDEEVEGR